MDTVQSSDNIERILARAHLDQEGSVVRSGVALADLVLKTLGKGLSVEVSFEGLKGASSSYFNVFLRRVKEGCGLAELDHNICLKFDSETQKTIYARSLESMIKGPRRPPPPPPPPPSSSGDEFIPRPLWKRILGLPSL